MCKALDDLYNSGVEQGQREGRLLGQKEGRTLGQKEGYMQGCNHEKLEVANRLLGILELEKIAEVVGLELETVKGLEKTC